jgi:hypothetical protein
MKYTIMIFAIGYISFLFPQDSSLIITPDGIFAARHITINPELDFLSAFEDTLFRGDIDNHTVCKINFDFNYDGIQDVALTDLYLWGAHIGPWEIYLGIGNNKYICICELWFHNDAVRFDSISIGKSTVTVFDRAGGADVDIVKYILTKESIKQTKRNKMHFENFKEMNEAFKEFRFQTLKDSCISVEEYLKNKVIKWKEGY